MLGYRIDEKNGMLPIQFRERGLWRDFDSFLPDDGTLSPASVQHAVSLARKDKARFPRSMMVLGQSNNKAKIEYWRMERFALPEAMAINTSIRSEIRGYLDLAEATEKALWSSCSAFARHMLGRGERAPDTKDIKAFVSQMVPIPYYWSTLETRFHAVLHKYTQEEDRDGIALDWWKDLRTVLKEAWALHCASVTAGDAWAIRAMVKAEGPVQRKLLEMNEEIKKYQSSEVP